MDVILLFRKYGRKFWVRLKCRGDTETLLQVFGPCCGGFKRFYWFVFERQQVIQTSFSLRVEARYNNTEGRRTSWSFLSPFAYFWSIVIFVEIRREFLLNVHLSFVRFEIMYHTPNTMPDTWLPFSKYLNDQHE